MKRDYPFTASACVAFSDPHGLIRETADHLEQHGARTTVGERGETILEYEFCRGILEAAHGYLLLRAEAPDISFLQEVRSELGDHVEEFAGLPVGSIIWKGNAGGSKTPPNFRLMTVAKVIDVTPHMRRIRLTGEALVRYTSSRNLHCKLLIPPEEHEPQWPSLDRNGRFVWPEGAGRPAIRKYTIRSVNPDEGWLDIDFVLHDDAGPGSRWAASATIGDVIGLVGPGGQSVALAKHYLLAGDETALPAIARLLETLPAGVKGIALIEVANKEEEQPIANRTGIEVRWLHRDGASAGTTTILQDAVAAIAQSDRPDELFVWVSCEFAAFKAIRACLKKEWRLEKGRHLVTAYWRRGMSEERAEKRESIANVLASVSKRVTDRLSGRVDRNDTG